MIVVDSTVIAYLYLPGDHTAKAESLLQRDADWVVPLLWAEGVSVVCRAVRRGVSGTSGRT